MLLLVYKFGAGFSKRVLSQTPLSLPFLLQIDRLILMESTGHEILACLLERFGVTTLQVACSLRGESIIDELNSN